MVLVLNGKLNHKEINHLSLYDIIVPWLSEYMGAYHMIERTVHSLSFSGLLHILPSFLAACYHLFLKFIQPLSAWATADCIQLGSSLTSCHGYRVNIYVIMAVYRHLV